MRRFPQSISLPQPAVLFLLMLLPAALHYWPQVLDWRLAALALLSCAAGTCCAVKLNAEPGTPLNSIPLFRRTWFTVYCGYSIALVLPHLLFHALFGEYALIPDWAPHLPGRLLLDMRIYATTDALLLAAVPAVITAFCCGALLSASGERLPDAPPAAPPLSISVDFLLVPIVFIVATWLYSLRIPAGMLMANRMDVTLNVWNQWWFRKALFEGLPMLETDYIYQPFGVSLYWHTFGLTNNVIGLLYRCLTGGDGVSTYNFTALLSFVLMGWATYLLARRRVGVWGGLFAGFAVALCGAHMVQLLEGHLGLANAQWVIFFMLFALRAFERASIGASIAAGIFWTLSFYTHFYHGMFCGIILGLMILCALARELTASPKYNSGVESTARFFNRRWILALAMLAGLIIFWQYWLVFILLLWCVVILRAGPVVAGRFSGRWWRALPLPVLIFLITASPWMIGMHRANVQAAGQLNWSRPPSYYASDVFSYIAPTRAVRGGSAFDFIWDRYDDAATESRSGFLGLPVILFAVYGMIRARRGQALWIFFAAVFVVLSLGSRLHVAGFTITHGDQMPYIVLEMVPFWSPGGMAGRFSLLATIAIAMIASVGVEHLLLRAGRFRHAAGAVSVLAVLVLGFPQVWLYRPPTPDFLDAIRKNPSNGVVLQFCSADTMFWLQTFHEKRIVHGFASRPRRSTARFIYDEPVFHELYYGKQLPAGREEALDILRGHGIRWIIVAEDWPRSTIESGLGLYPAAVDDASNAYLYLVK